MSVLQDNEYFEATDNLTGEIVTKKLLDYDHGLRQFDLKLLVTVSVTTCNTFIETLI